MYIFKAENEYLINKKTIYFLDGCLIVFYGISTLLDYLMPNPVYIYIYIWFVR